MDILVTFDNATGLGDYAVADGDLAGDETLDSDVITSLFTDREADPSDAIPGNGTDPRGWWGDTAFVVDQGDAPADRIGSKLWLRVNALLTPATLAQIAQDILQALHWMIEDGVAQSITCTGKQLSIMEAAFPITIARKVAGQTVTTTYDAMWNATLGLKTVSRQDVAGS
jgi:phage gp46-like protein